MKGSGMKAASSPSRPRRGSVKLQGFAGINGTAAAPKLASTAPSLSPSRLALLTLLLVPFAVVGTFLAASRGCSSKLHSCEEASFALINSKVLLELEKSLEGAAEAASDVRPKVPFLRHMAAFADLRRMLEVTAGDGVNKSTAPRILRAAALGLSGCEARIQAVQGEADGLKAQVQEQQREVVRLQRGQEQETPQVDCSRCAAAEGAHALGAADADLLRGNKDLLGMDAKAMAQEIVRLRELVSGMKVGMRRLRRANKQLEKDNARALQQKSSSSLDQGYRCEATAREMKQYLDYEPHKSCPNDWYFVQRLIFKKQCYALPRRRCRAVTPANPVEPLPFPGSLFNQAVLDDRSVRWDLHDCKSFECIINRGGGDCKDCFNLTKEEKRWLHPFRGTIPMRDVIALKNGSLRLGLDVGGGTGSFAAHMARYNVTVMTTALNFETFRTYAGLPYMETIALRGLIPLHVPHGSRLPLYDGVLDVIHSMNSIKYIPLPQFEELVFEWDRVLRVGGILWFDMFYAQTAVMPKYVAVLDLLEYKKLYWNFTPKTDVAERGGEHIYLNCVLEKQPAPGNVVLRGPAKEDTKW